MIREIDALIGSTRSRPPYAARAQPETLANSLEINSDKLLAHEAQQRRARAEMLFKISAALEVSMSYFFN